MGANIIQFLGTNIQEYFSKKPRYNFFKTLKYILYKFVFDDLKLQSFQLEFPWLNFAAIEFINKFTDKKENLHVFEYGSGGSTIFFLKQGFNVVSVEHCKNWYENVIKKVNQNEKWKEKWEKFYIEPEYDGLKQTTKEIENPSMYKSKGFDEYNFKKYVLTLENYPASFFDIILIDGRSRPSCILHAVGRVKPGGIIIIDNSERDYYLTEKTINILNDYRVVFDAFAPILGVKTFTRTTIFQKKY